MRSSKPTLAIRVLSPVFTSFASRSYFFVTVSRSARASSRLITSISRVGLTEPLTWMILGSSKQRTTCTIASTSRIWLKNLLPKPSPLLAPATSPAISTNSIAAGITF